MHVRSSMIENGNSKRSFPFFDEKRDRPKLPHGMNNEHMSLVGLGMKIRPSRSMKVKLAQKLHWYGEKVNRKLGSNYPTLPYSPGSHWDKSVLNLLNSELNLSDLITFAWIYWPDPTSIKTGLGVLAFQCNLLLSQYYRLFCSYLLDLSNKQQQQQQLIDLT